MGENSGIQWTHHTFNGWWGCQRVSPGCVNCYAEALDKRVGGGIDPKDGVKKTRWGAKAPRIRTSAANWRKPLAWNAAAAKAGVRHRVFCSSMADVFEDRPELEAWRKDLFGLIAATPHLDWLLLTKRPENIARLWPLYAMAPGNVGMLGEVRDCPRPSEVLWPNVWLGTTVEDQQRANERIPELLKVPARVRFLSMEPLLEHVDLTKVPTVSETFESPLLRPDWVIIGGESGSSARPFYLDWARSLVHQAVQLGAAPFVKQMGSQPWLIGDQPHRRVELVDHHGGDMAEWPEDLRVREFPR